MSKPRKTTGKHIEIRTKCDGSKCQQTEVSNVNEMRF